MKEFDDLFLQFVERKQRCQAVMLQYENLWDVARWLHQKCGYETKVNASDGLTLEVLKNGQILFTADAREGDAVIYRDIDNISVMPGREFRTTWERED